MTRINQFVIEHEPITLWLDRINAAGVLVFLFLLPFHLFIKTLIPDPVGTYWKEGLLAILVLVWLVRSAIDRRLRFTGTWLDWAALAYAGLIVLRLLLDRSGLVGFWGAYISIMYLPLFWLVPAALRFYPHGLKILVTGLTVVGGILALGGVVEFILDRPLLPSAEILQRQGFADVYVYGTQLRRVYFVLDSPTILANLLAMLMPLALLQAFQSQKRWERISYAALILLMFVAIIFTFSRGIWAAMAATYVILVVFKFVTERNRKFLLGMAGVAAVAVAVMLIVLFSQPVTNTNQYTLELIQAEYRAAPLSGSVSLIEAEPEVGEPEHQDWQLYDPIDRMEDWREVVFTHPGPEKKAEVIYRVELPENAALRFSIALSPEVWDPEKGDGVNFELYLTESGSSQDGTIIFQRYLNPKLNPSDRRWRNYIVDISGWSGKTVDLYLKAGPGAEHNDAYDWAGWADLELGSLDPGYLEANQASDTNPVAQHLASITDWVRDESNRDRLAAWNLGLAAWQKNPLWGVGLGATGAAAFRTMPETAIATESQILKSLVELGIPGLLVWLFIWFVIGRLVIQTYRQETSSAGKLLILALAGSLLIVFIDGWVYQNLEVKQVNAYFWTFAGMVAFLHRREQ